MKNMCTVVPALGDPRRERPPAVYGHVSNVPTHVNVTLPAIGGHLPKGPATRNDFINDIVNDARADAIFATLKAIVDDEKSTISSTMSLRVAWP